MQEKRWLKIVFTLSLGAVFLLAALNYLVDPYEVFRSNYLKHPLQLNKRYLKVKHLEENPTKYDSYLLGSSRIGTTQPEVVEQYLPNSNFYNLTVSLGSILDNIMLIKHLLKIEHEVKNLYMQIDINAMLIYKQGKSDYQRKYPPSLTNRDEFEFYFEYLTIFPLQNIKGKVAINFNQYDRLKCPVNDIEETGCFFLPYQDSLIAADLETYIAEEVTFNHLAPERKVNGLHIEETMRALAVIKKLCDENKINLIPFVTPHNHNMLNTFNSEDYLYFLSAIAEVLPYWDFSGYNSITTDNKNYYEHSHYRENVSKLIAARIFNDTTIAVPNDFGKHVHLENIKRHLEERKEELKHNDLSYQ